jgi:hypothetical protein
VTEHPKIVNGAFKKSDAIRIRLERSLEARRASHFCDVIGIFVFVFFTFVHPLALSTSNLDISLGFDRKISIIVKLKKYCCGVF